VLGPLQHRVRPVPDVQGGQYRCVPPRHDKAHIAKAVNATVISLDEAPQGYKDFDSGVAKKFVLNPHGLIKS
jgi:hypothetical protein